MIESVLKAILSDGARARCILNILKYIIFITKIEFSEQH